VHLCEYIARVYLRGGAHVPLDCRKHTTSPANQSNDSPPTKKASAAARQPEFPRCTTHCARCPTHVQRSIILLPVAASLLTSSNRRHGNGKLKTKRSLPTTSPPPPFPPSSVDVGSHFEVSTSLHAARMSQCQPLCQCCSQVQVSAAVTFGQGPIPASARSLPGPRRAPARATGFGGIVGGA
jgi:hypothetical protein